MPDLNELLKWSLANSGTPTGATAAPVDGRSNMAALHPSDPLHPSNESAVAAPPPAPRSDLNADMLEVIMGKADSTLMKEQLEVAVDESKSVEDRVQALDNFEMVRTPLVAVGIRTEGGVAHRVDRQRQQHYIDEALGTSAESAGIARGRHCDADLLGHRDRGAEQPKSARGRALLRYQ
jgi:hypothetical protein